MSVYISATNEDKGSISYSHDSGVYAQDQLVVTLSAPEGCTIAFTTDGRIPTAREDCGLQEVDIVLEDGGTGYLIRNRDRMVYPDLSRSFLLDDPTLPSSRVLRACTISPSGEAGEPDTKVYFLNKDFHRLFPGCLVLSITADPDDLLDYEHGILAAGAFYDTWKQTSEAQEHISRSESWLFQSNITQRGRAWERPCRLQIYDGGDIPTAEVSAGIRVTGSVSRGENQKSFNIYFRKAYGSKYLDYELFPGVSHLRSFRLVAGGNNTEWLKFKEAFLQELVGDRHFTHIRFRPAVLFLNGEYWGPYLLSEKVSPQMLHDHHGVDTDQVVLVKEGKRKEGSEQYILLYKDLMSYAQKDLSDPDTWKEFCRAMDIRSMADYCAARIYIGDFDWWPEKNDILWRTRDTSFNEGRWQYILYDVDFSSGLYDDERTAPETDHFRLAAERYPLFAAALHNQEFYTLFLTSLREIGKVNCSRIRVLWLLRRYVRRWTPLMPDYYKRFGDRHNLWRIALKNTVRFFMKRYRILLARVLEERETGAEE